MEGIVQFPTRTLLGLRTHPQVQARRLEYGGVGCLVHALEDEHYTVRLAATRVVAALGARSEPHLRTHCVAALLDLFNDDEDCVRMAVRVHAQVAPSGLTWMPKRLAGGVARLRVQWRLCVSRVSPHVRQLSWGTHVARPRG